MSWLTDLADIVGGGLKWLGGDTLGAGLARTAITGYALNKVTKNVKKETILPEPAQTANNPAMNPLPDLGVRLQINPSSDNRVPLVYGTAQLSGIITDVELVNGNRDLYVCFTICERTGTLLSTNQPSQFSLDAVYINDQEVQFNTNGYSVLYTVDRTGYQDRSLEGLVDVFFFAGNSNTPRFPVGFAGTPTSMAYDIMPGWTSVYAMTDLVFAIVKLTYNPSRGVDKIPTVRFKVSNSMTYPGDVIMDYMTSSRYGCGIPAAEIYSA